MSTRTVLIKRGALYPKVDARLKNSDGTAIDLTTADGVTFSMRRLVDGEPGDVILQDEACTVVTAASGIVEYAWQTGETDIAGAHIGEFTITWSPGVTEIVPTKGYLNVRILATVVD